MAVAQIVQHGLFGGRTGHGDAPEMLHPVLSGVDGGAKSHALGNMPDEGQAGVTGRLGQGEVGLLVEH